MRPVPPSTGGDYSLPHVRGLQREQAAAVCYRIGHRGVEFLLVRTRSGRWTFPKGGVEPGLSHAQSAALEAFEEAGVHGRMEVVAFARYLRRRSSKAGEAVCVLAYLCEVRRLSKPQEPKRDRTWFSAEKAKRRLQEGRTSECGAELAAVVDRAVARVQRLPSDSGAEVGSGNKSQDALMRVSFEASETAWRRGNVASIGRLVRRDLPSAAIEIAAAERPRLLLGEAPQDRRPLLRLASESKSSPSAGVKTKS